MSKIYVRSSIWFIFALAFVAGNYLAFPYIAKADYTIDTSTTSADEAFCGGLYSNGSHGNFEKCAQAFTTTDAGDIEGVTVGTRKQGSPVDELIVSIQADNSGEPDGTPIDSDMISGASLGGSCADAVFDFASTPLDASTKYWIVLERSGSTNNTNKYVGCGGDSASSGEEAANYTGSVWNTRTPNYRVVLEIVSEGGGGEEATSTTATTTLISDPNRDFAQGLWLFLAGFALMLWLFAKLR